MSDTVEIPQTAETRRAEVFAEAVRVLVRLRIISGQDDCIRALWEATRR